MNFSSIEFVERKVYENKNHKTDKNTRILGADHQLHNSARRVLGPLSNLIWQVIKRCPVSKGEEEKDGVHLLLTGLGESCHDYRYTLYCLS